MTFSTYAYSGIGARTNNEDYFSYQNDLWVLADGLGGHDSGEVASKTACEAVMEYVKSESVPSDRESLEKIIDYANNAVLRAQTENESLKSMRTTIVFASAVSGTLRYANVGDSRFYYFKNGKLFKQSIDHSVSALSAKIGDIRYEDIRGDDDRNKLLKVLGSEEKLGVTAPEDVIITEPGDAFLLCSDGFWEYVYETEMEFDLLKSDSPQEWLRHMLKRVYLKTQNENNDNFTAIAVTVS